MLRNNMASIKSMIPHGLRTWLRNTRRSRVQRKRFSSLLRPSDAFLIGHPKSGNTWTAYMLGIVVNRDLENSINTANIGDFIPTIHHNDLAIGDFPHLRSPRIFRNEAPIFPMLYPRTVYLVRDPRAALLSYYHHCVHDTGDHDWPIDSFVDEMLANGCIKRLEPYLVRWDIQVRHWLERAKKQPVLIVRYEDLKQNQQEALIRMAEFLGIPYDTAIIDLAVQRSSFSSMRKEEQVYGSESFAGEKGSKGFFVRKGKVDSWKEEMPGESIRKIEDAFGEVMRKIGYDL